MTEILTTKSTTYKGCKIIVQVTMKDTGVTPYVNIWLREKSGAPWKKTKVKPGNNIQETVDNEVERAKRLIRSRASTRAQARRVEIE